MEGLIIQGLSVDELLIKIESIVKQQVEQGINKLRAEETEKLLSVSATCKIFVPAITRQTLHAWTNQGYIPSHTIGRNVYYKLSDILSSAKRLNKIIRSDLKAA